MAASEELHPKYRLGEGKLSIQHMKRKGATAMPRPHSHSSVELYYLLDGERVYFVDGRVVTVRKGELILIAEGELHSTASSEVAEFERILIHYDRDVLPSSLRPLDLLAGERRFRVFALTLRERTEAERILRRMLEECSQAKPYYDACCQSLLAELVVLLGRCDRDPSANVPRDSLHHKVSEIASYLREHYRESLTLEETAKRFYVSSSYLSRIFHRLTGFGFREYILHLRVREAQRLLAGTRMRMNEIAPAVGFEYLSHFNKAFKKATGLTPMQYRKQAKTGALRPDGPAEG